MKLIIAILLSSACYFNAFSADTFCAQAPTIEMAVEESDCLRGNQPPTQHSMLLAPVGRQCCKFCPAHCGAYTHRQWYAEIWECTKFPCLQASEEEREHEECCCPCRIILFPLAAGTTCLCDCLIHLRLCEKSDEH